MYDDKIRRTIYLSERTNQLLNDYMTVYHTSDTTGSNYGGASATIEAAVQNFCWTPGVKEYRGYYEEVKKKDVSQEKEE